VCAVIVAVMATITLCVGAHALVTPAIKQSYLRRRSVKDLRADARASSAAFAANEISSATSTAGPQVPIHKTNDDY